MDKRIFAFFERDRRAPNERFAFFFRGRKRVAETFDRVGVCKNKIDRKTNFSTLTDIIEPRAMGMAWLMVSTQALLAAGFAIALRLRQPLLSGAPA